MRCRHIEKVIAEIKSISDLCSANVVSKQCPGEALKCNLQLCILGCRICGLRGVEGTFEMLGSAGLCRKGRLPKADVFSCQSNKGACGGLGGIGVGQQPFVSGPQQRTLRTDSRRVRRIGVGAAWQYDTGPETLPFLRGARSVVQCGGIQFHSMAGGYSKSFHAMCVQCFAANLLLVSYQQNRLVSKDINLRISMVFQTVQGPVVAVT